MMTVDWEKATGELTKKLNPDHVKGRQQGGTQVQYIEGWRAVDEMNRIFGFGSWNRETVDIRQIGADREVNGKVRVDYMARVRVCVGDVIRDGCGFGQGIDRDVGQAHESALKEAETDATKRAMMTFGNPFGLALYDKSRENVGRDEPSAFGQKPKQEPKPKERDPKAITDAMVGRVKSAESGEALKGLINQDRFSEAWDWLALEAPEMSRAVKNAVDERRAGFEKADA